MIFGIIPISINFESIINQIENEVTEMDDLIKGVKIGKILTKDDEKKETKKKNSTRNRRTEKKKKK